MSNAGAETVSIQMDRMYRWQRHIYDLTRKPYLLGRDRLIASLGVPAGGHVLEIGCGTGRNLVQAARQYPHGCFYGFDISSVMLDTARQSIEQAKLPARIKLAQGDATGFDTAHLFGRDQFDRIFVSYSLSMIPDWCKTLELAAQALAPGGALLIADFHDGRNVPAPLRTLLFKWLAMFSVFPRHNMEEALAQTAQSHGLKMDFEQLYGGYAMCAILRRPHITIATANGGNAQAA